MTLPFLVNSLAALQRCSHPQNPPSRWIRPGKTILPLLYRIGGKILRFQGLFRGRDLCSCRSSLHISPVATYFPMPGARRRRIPILLQAASCTVDPFENHVDPRSKNSAAQNGSPVRQGQDDTLVVIISSRKPRVSGPLAANPSSRSPQTPHD